MIDYSSDSLDRSLHALSDPTRRKMLARLVEGDSTVSELSEPFEMSLAAVSKHLQVLERANFIQKVKSGRTITCRARLAPLDEVAELLVDLAKYWNSQLDSLEKYLATDMDQKGIKNGNTKSGKPAKTSHSTSNKRKKR